MSEEHTNPSAIVGAWRIVSIALAGDSSQASRDDGLGTDGLILYGPSGYMTAHIVLPGRREVGSGTAMRNPSHHAYFGTYTLDADAMTITHHRLANNNPGLPIDVVRSYQLSDNGRRLVLSPLGGPGDQLTFEQLGR